MILNVFVALQLSIIRFDYQRDAIRFNLSINPTLEAEKIIPGVDDARQQQSSQLKKSTTVAKCIFIKCLLLF